jgi:hypothetical protein
VTVKVILADILDRHEFIDAGVVDEDIEAAVVLDRRVDHALRSRAGGDVAADGDRVAAGRGNRGDHRVRTRLAGCIVDDDGRAFGGERLGDGGSDALGRSGDDGHLAVELAHVRLLMRDIGK